MNFPSKESLDLLKKFDALPSTPEKDEISRLYLNDEIGTFEFFGLASTYVENFSSFCSDERPCIPCFTNEGRCTESK